MSSFRCLSSAALLGLLAFWSGCGGVSDPGPLTGHDDGDGGSGVSGGAGGSRNQDPDETVAGGGDPGTGNGGASGSEGIDPELVIDGIGGRAGSPGNGGGGTGPAGNGGSTAAGTGGTEWGSGGAEPGTGGTDPGSGGTDSGSGGTFDPGSGGTESGIGGTESSGGTDSGSGGTFDPGSGGTESGIGGTFDPGVGGTDSGNGGTESGAGGTDGEDENGGAGGADESGGTGGEIGQGGQGGSDEPPPIVDVEVGRCDAFEPCGGDVEGVWTYTGACVDLDDLGLSEQAIEDMCPGAQLTLSGQVSGTLSFEGGVVTRQGQSSAQGQVSVPALCAVALGGCGGVEDQLADAGLLGAVCLGQGSPFLPSCRCSFAIDAPEIEQVPFDTDGDVIRLADGREFAYCAAGDSLSYSELGTATEPGVRELTRR